MPKHQKRSAGFHTPLVQPVKRQRADPKNPMSPAMSSYPRTMQEIADFFSHTFERIQFERATLNNGKKESRQQYFNIVIELNAQTSGGENSQGLHWLRIARITSEPIIVRGRSPGHYKDGRRDNHDSIRHGGDDMGLDNAMALPIIALGQWHTESRTQR